MACGRHDCGHEIDHVHPSTYNISKTDRLFTFQDMCYRSADPNTHKADEWMVKFLLQQSSPIDDKTTPSLENAAPKFLSRDRGRYAIDAPCVLK